MVSPPQSPPHRQVSAFSETTHLRFLWSTGRTAKVNTKTRSINLTRTHTSLHRKLSSNKDNTLTTEFLHKDLDRRHLSMPVLNLTAARKAGRMCPTPTPL
jgi:hypothetical protein